VLSAAEIRAAVKLDLQLRNVDAIFDRVFGSAIAYQGKRGNVERGNVDTRCSLHL
jgi:hypothetical protein